MVAYDQSQDIAVLRLAAASGLKTVSLAGSAVVKVGEKVLALGNAQGQGGAPTAAAGMITAPDQSITATDKGAPPPSSTSAPPPSSASRSCRTAS